jgi:hypothetical protein
MASAVGEVVALERKEVEEERFVEKRSAGFRERVREVELAAYSAGEHELLGLGREPGPGLELERQLVIERFEQLALEQRRALELVDCPPALSAATRGYVVAE